MAFELTLFTLLILFAFVSDSRWSWADDHDVQFGLRGGERMTVSEMLDVHPDIIEWIANLPLLSDLDRSIAEEILENPNDYIRSIAESFPAPWEICEDTVEEVDTVLICEDEGSAEFPVFGCTRCGTDHSDTMYELARQAEYEDQAFEAHRDERHQEGW